MLNRGMLAALLAILSVPASAAVSVRVAETHPVSPASLGHWGRFDLRIEYETDRAMRVRADAFSGSERVTSITSGSPRREPGAGEALFWLAFTEPKRVDRVVVRLEDEETHTALAETALEVDLTWTGEKGAAAGVRPDWIRRLQDEQDRRISAQGVPSDGWPSGMGTLVIVLAVWMVPGYFLLQPFAIWRTRGRWRWAAAAPLVPMGAVVLYTIFAFLAGSNLFPLFLIFLAPPAFLYLVVLVLLARAAGAWGKEKGPASGRGGAVRGRTGA
jgi:hypothetical protein